MTARDVMKALPGDILTRFWTIDLFDDRRVRIWSATPIAGIEPQHVLRGEGAFGYLEQSLADIILGRWEDGPFWLMKTLNLKWRDSLVALRPPCAETACPETGLHRLALDLPDDLLWLRMVLS